MIILPDFKTFRVAVEKIHQNSNNGSFAVRIIFVEMTLMLFFSYDYGANVFEAVEKITTYENNYHKCSLCVIVWIATAHE